MSCLSPRMRISALLCVCVLFGALVPTLAAPKPVDLPATIPAVGYAKFSPTKSRTVWLFFKKSLPAATVASADASAIGKTIPADLAGLVNGRSSYAVNAPADGPYLVLLRVKSTAKDCTLGVEVDGAKQTDLKVPQSLTPTRYNDVKCNVTLKAGAHTITVVWNANATASELPVLHYLRVCDLPNSRTVRVNAGGYTPFIDAQGHVWVADAGFVDGDTVDRGDIAIKNTTEPDLYRTEHYGMTEFSAKLENGKYLVRLHFAETYDGFSQDGERVFTVDVMGTVLKNLDILKEVKTINTALVKEVPVTITGGKLTIKFTSVENNAEINAIEVIPAP